MAVKITNNASTLLASSINTSATSISVTSSTGARFPSLSVSEWFPVVVVDGSGNYEIMRATARSGDVITVTRAQEGTSARSFSAGARVDLRLTAAALADIVAGIEAEIDASLVTLRGELNAPSGTRALFHQTAAPTGWTKDTTHDDKALRVVSGTVGSGGSVNFSTAFARTAVDGKVLTRVHLPNLNFDVAIPSGQGNHGHGVNNGTGVRRTGGAGNITATLPSDERESDITVQAATLPAMSGTAASGGSDTAHAHDIDLRVKYVDAILAQKD